MLADNRYCPRCDEKTEWTNEADGSLTLLCQGCGLGIQSELTDEEADRLARHEARQPRGRRHYEHV